MGRLLPSPRIGKCDELEMRFKQLYEEAFKANNYALDNIVPELNKLKDWNKEVTTSSGVTYVSVP